MKDEIKVPGIARTLVGFIAARPWMTLLMGLAIMAAFAPGLGQLKREFTYRGYFYPTDPMLVEFDKFERQFGNDDAVVLAVHSPSGLFDVESAELLRTLTAEMWKVDEIIRVDSLANYNWVHAEGDDLIVEPFFPELGPLDAKLLAERKEVALKHEVLPQYLVSTDAKTAMIFGTVKPKLNSAPKAAEIVRAVRKLIDAHRTGDHEYHISGGPEVTYSFKDAAIGDASLLYPLGFLLTFIFLAILLRSFKGILLSLLVVFPAIICSMGAMGYLGVELTNITFIIPQILLAIGVADSIHILVTHYRTMASGEERRESAEYALLKNFMPTFLTSITTAVGFFSFASASIKPVVGLGVVAGCGTLFAWLLTYLILGPALFLVPLRRKVMPSNKVELAERRARRFTDWLIRNRTVVLLTYGALCVAAMVLAAKNTVNSDNYKYFREGYPLRVANDFIEANIGGARGTELAIEADEAEAIKDPAFLAKVDKFQAWIEAQPKVTRALSILDVLKMTHRSLNGDDQAFYRLASTKNEVAQELLFYEMGLGNGQSLNDRVTVKNDALRITILWTITTSREVVDFIDEIKAKGESMGLRVVATGKNRIWQSMNRYVVQSFISSITIAFILISIILMVFFRSVGLGLLAMLPNAVPLIIGGGILYLIGKPLDVGVALVTSVCLGIAVDDTIHVLSNYNRLRAEGKSKRSAVADVLANTSPALITTSIILIFGFGIFVFGTFVPNIYFGLMVAIVLSVALLTDLSFLPALLLYGSDRDD